MQKARFLFPLLAVLSLLMAGCGGSLGSSGMVTADSKSAPVTLTMTDDPPSGVDVLFFQVSLTDATLTSASGSTVELLNNNTPIQIDVTQLQALSAFLSAVSVPADTYNSLSLTFASPQLVIYNQSDSSLGSSCAVGTVCQLTPTIDNSATLNFTTSPFPVTVATGSPLGFLVDFHLNTIIQSDLSVNLGVTNGVTVSQLQSTPPTKASRLGSLTGTVESVDATNNQFTLQTKWGRTFTVSTGSSTTYNDFPTSVCATSAFSCLAAQQIVQVQVSGVDSSGVLTASQVTYVQQASQQTVEGTIVGFESNPPAGEVIADLILHRSPADSVKLPPGGYAKVTIYSQTSGSNTAATFSIDNNGFTIPTAYTFASTSDLTLGQDIQVTVVSGTLQEATASTQIHGWGPPPSVSFTASNVQLEPVQITGTVSNISSPAFTLNFVFAPWPWAVIQFDTETTTQTTYENFTTNDFTGLADNDWVSVNGWLFKAPTTTTLPVIVAQDIVQHQAWWF